MKNNNIVVSILFLGSLLIAFPAYTYNNPKTHTDYISDFILGLTTGAAHGLVNEAVYDTLFKNNNQESQKNAYRFVAYAVANGTLLPGTSTRSSAHLWGKALGQSALQSMITVKDGTIQRRDTISINFNFNFIVAALYNCYINF
jgi:hypothetical protein